VAKKRRRGHRSVSITAIFKLGVSAIRGLILNREEEWLLTFGDQRRNRAPSGAVD
jgi:hypothetical protein